MPGYIAKVLHKFQHIKPSKDQYAPHKWTEPVYGKQHQTAIEDNKNPILPPSQTKELQQISGSLLYYACAIESPILPALNKIFHCQASPTINTYNKRKMLLDYCATHPNEKIRFRASQMILHVDTDAAYLVVPKARSRIAGYYYLAQYPTADAIPKPILNDAIHVECKTLKHVVASAAEAETGRLSHNGKSILQI